MIGHPPEVWASGPSHCSRESEGWGGQDNYRDQPRRVPRGPGTEGAGCGYGSPGECHQRPRPRQTGADHDGLRLPPGWFGPQLRRCGYRGRRGVDCAGDCGFGRGRGRAGEHAGPGDPAEGRPRRGRGAVRLCPARQPAFPGAADGELPDGSRFRSDTDSVRVLRAGGSGAAPGDAGPAAEDAEPGPRCARGGAHDVRREDSPLGRGGRRGEEAFWRPGLPVGDSAKCQAV